MRESGRVNGKPLGVLGIVFAWEALGQTVVGARIDFEGSDELFKQQRGAIMTKINAKPVCLAHAASPGYETYRTGWHSLLIRSLD